LGSIYQQLRQPVITLKIQQRTMSSLIVSLLLAVLLILAESYSKCPRTSVASTSTKHLIVNNGWVRSVGIISSSSRLYAAAPEAPKGKGPPPRKAPKDDVVQVSHFFSNFKKLCLRRRLSRSSIDITYDYSALKLFSADNCQVHYLLQNLALILSHHILSHHKSSRRIT
jgi:hypothetical protein